MKRFVSILVCTLMLFTSNRHAHGSSMQDRAAATENLYRPGEGCEDGAYTATSMSMLGWGVIIAASITVLCLFVQGTRSSSSSSSS